MIDKLVEIDSVEIRAIGVEGAASLRRAVLYPNKQACDLIADADRDDLARHFGAFRGSNLIGVCSVTPDTIHLDDRVYHWRLRGMAVLQADRGLGVGKLLLLAGIRYVDQAPEVGLWCNGRTDALNFYRNLGFHNTGATWMGPDRVERVKLCRP